ncbi:MAG: molybdopterin-dependent oxidoreductase [Pseudomonadota bacterium]
MSPHRIVKSICFECHSRCGALIEVDNGRIVNVKGDKDHPFSRGFICPKCRATKEIIYHPERLTHPAKRVGEKGKGKWVDISWDEAIGEIASKLLKIRNSHGAEAVVFGQGTTRGLPPYINRFLSLFGSPNFMGTQNLSGYPIMAGSIFTCGFSFMANADYGNSRCMLLWGQNPHSAWPGLFLNDIYDGLRKKAKLIVVDPRKTEIASRADIWLRIRPGTDDALALGMLNIIIEKGLYDKDFVENWTVGFDKLKSHVKTFTPAKTAEITWLDPETIEKATVLYARSKPACIGAGMAGVCQNTNSFQLNRAITILSAITGNLEVKGGNLSYPSPLKERACYGPDFDACKNLPPQQSQKRLGAREFPGIRYTLSPAESVWKAIIEEVPYSVKALLLFANNSMISFANSNAVREALSKIDFLVCVDYFRTPTTEMADIVLPAAHWTERDDIEDLMMKNYLFCQPKAVNPPETCWDEKKILIELAKKMKLEGYWSSVEESLDYRLEPAGVTFEEFRKLGKISIPIAYKQYEKEGRFQTSSSKVELYSERLADLGLSPLPIYVEPPESPLNTPELAKEYPLVLTTGGRSIAYLHSAHRNIPSLRKRFSNPSVEICPDTMEKEGLKKDDWVWIITPRGKMKSRVKPFAGLHPAVIHVYHGFWYSFEDGWKTVNDNILTDQMAHDPAVSSTQLRGLLCRIEKCNPTA